MQKSKSVTYCGDQQLMAPLDLEHSYCSYCSLFSTEKTLLAHLTLRYCMKSLIGMYYKLAQELLRSMWLTIIKIMLCVGGFFKCEKNIVPKHSLTKVWIKLKLLKEKGL